MQQSEDAKLEAQFSVLNSYVICGISALAQKIEQMLESNISFLQQDERTN